jgi:lipid A 4'-phosphatase
MSMQRGESQRAIWLGVGVLVLLTLPFAFSDLDLTVASWFYHSGWSGGDGQPWYFLYRYGTLPGLLLAAGALGALLGSWLRPELVRWRRPAAVILVAMVLGPGLLVNVVGKGYWGRSRPREVTAFGGDLPFQRVIQPGTPGRGKSFPAGHPSVGYFIGVLFFLDPSRRRRWSWLAVGAVYGTLMGIGRIAAGGHFASDVLWSGGLTYLAAAFSAWVLPAAESAGKIRAQVQAARPGTLPLGIIIGALCLGLTATFFLIATPYYKEWSGSVAGAPGLTAIRLPPAPGGESIRVVKVHQEPALVVSAGLQGFGFPKLRLEGQLESQVTGTTLTAALTLRLQGLVTERTGNIVYQVRDDLAVIQDAPAK